MRDTRSELLAQAETLVRGRGYSGFSYADLAEAVGIRKASIHHYFRTKEDLAGALLAAYDARYDAGLAAILRESPTGLGRIEAYGALYLTGVEAGLGCLCAAFAVELETLPESLRAAVARFLEKHLDWLEEAVRAGIGDGSVRGGLDPADAARMALATLEGALLFERLLGGRDGFSRTLRALRDSLGRPPTH